MRSSVRRDKAMNPEKIWEEETTRKQIGQVEVRLLILPGVFIL
jgi:hypothetical protein